MLRSLPARWLLLLSACACGSTSVTPVEPRHGLEAGGWRVELDPGTGSLIWSTKTSAGGTTPILRTPGVRVTTAQPGGAAVGELPFRSLRLTGTSWELAAGSHPEHEVRVQIDLLATGNGARILVRDRVRARSELVALELEHRWMLDGIDSHVAPQASDRDPAWIPQTEYRAPLIGLFRGRSAAILSPDLELLGRNHRVPQGLRLGTEKDRFLSQVMGLEPVGDPAPRGQVVRGEELLFAHELLLDGDCDAGDMVQARLDALWRQHAAPTLAAGSRRLDQRSARTWASLLAERLELLGSSLPKTSRPWLGPSGPGRQVQDLSEAWLLPALGLGLSAQHADSATQAALASRLLAAVMDMPRRSGVLPTALVVGPGQPLAVLFERSVADAGRFETTELALACVRMLQAARLLPELRQGVRIACAVSMRFLLTHQRQNGEFPDGFEPAYLAPRPAGRALAANAAIAWFLAEYWRDCGDSSALAGSRRALGWLCAQQATGPRPPAQVSACMALAALTLQETETRPDPGLLRVAELALTRLALDQALWPAPWSQDPVIGSVEVGANRSEQARAHRLATEAWFAAAAAIGNHGYLQRGIAALRHALAGLPKGAFGPGDPDASTCGALLVLLDAALDKLGEASIDWAGGFGEGVDSVWFEDLSIQGEKLTCRLLTHAADRPSARVRFRRLPANLQEAELVVGEVDLGRVPVANLLAGIDLPTQVLPRLTFAPPAQLRGGDAWFPRAERTGPLPAGASIQVEVDTGRDQVQVCKLDPAGGDSLLATEPVLVPEATVGSRMSARLVLHAHGRSRPGSWHPIALGDSRCLDIGDGDEHELQSGAGTRITRFQDGRQNAREARGSASFTYRLPVPREASALHLQIQLHGAVHVETAGHLLHRDSRVETEPVRDLVLELSDRRLWRDGELPLTFRPALPQAESGVQVARIEWRFPSESKPISEAEAMGADLVRTPTAPRLRVTVVPVEFAGRQLHATEHTLRQAFFAGAEYRLTPPPNSRLSAGSVAEFLAALSGGRTLLEGEVLPLQAIDAGGSERSLVGILQELGARLASVAARTDLVVLVLPVGAMPAAEFGTAVPLGRALVRAAPQVERVVAIALPEREPDGTFLATGNASAAVLTAVFGTVDRSLPDNGHFGDLALSWTRGGHVPAGPTGLDLATMGWADRLRLPPRNQTRIDLAPLNEGRTLFELPCAGPPDRGTLWIEGRAPGSGEPGLTQAGLLVAWNHGLNPPRIIDRSGQSATPRVLRLSALLPTWETPFVPGDAARDLFTNDFDLTERTSPSLATPQGELFWAVKARLVRGGAASLSLRYLPADLLAGTELDFVCGSERGAAPLAAGSADRPGSVARTKDAVRLVPPTERGGFVEAWLPAPPVAGPCRLFVALGAVEGDGEAVLQIERGAARLTTPILARDSYRLCVLEVHEATHTGPTRVRLTTVAEGRALQVAVVQALAVPREPVMHAVQRGGEAVPPRTLMDGAIYADPLVLRAGASTVLPIVLPAASGPLRLVAGLDAVGATAESRLTLRLRERGQPARTLLDRQPFRRARERTPLDCLLIALPNRFQDSVAMLELTAEGADLVLPCLEIARP